MVCELVDGEACQFTAAQCRNKSKEDERPVARNSQVQLCRPARGAPDLGGGVGVQDVEQLAGLRGAA